MTELFTVEWLGGVSEHHYRQARPDEDLPWDSLDASRYPEPLLAAARDVWTGVALSEYAAIAAFAEVVHALAAARAPLDFIGMISDFLADEVYHVELACRLLTRLGGAAPREFDPARLAPVVTPEATPLQRSNELAVRIGCVAEVFASETAVPMMKETTHPLVRAVYQRILRDEARHRRFGSLYFEWAAERLDDRERERLGLVALSALAAYAPIWRKVARMGETPWKPSEIHELGWIEPSRYVPLAQGAVRDHIVPELRALGIVVPEHELAALLEA
jgi:hypothetical protein